MKSFMKSRAMTLLTAVLLFLAVGSSAFAYEATTLRNGMRGEEVRELQQGLITLGYLKGTADGIFGNNTENAVRRFQKKNKLTSDGLAGAKTRALIQSKAAAESSGSSAAASQSAQSGGTASSSSNTASSQSAQTASTSSLFGGNYATLRSGSRGSRVRVLQSALISLNYLSGSADGSFGKQTKAAVIAFQKASRLTADGAAGKKTLTALEKAVQSGSKASAPQEAVTTPAPDSSGSSQTDTGSINEKIAGPSTSSVQLLSWFDQVKPSIAGGQHLLVYEPVSGLSWTLRVLARGRHCDAEPLTAQDTRTMLKAFGGVNTWNQKGVYVRLPDGRWSVASTHDMPHDSGTIKDNDFNGHLCVHFLRTMAEAQQNDPKYGVANQKTIRSLWKSLTGQDVTD